MIRINFISFRKPQNFIKDDDDENEEDVDLNTLPEDYQSLNTNNGNGFKKHGFKQIYDDNCTSHTNGGYSKDEIEELKCNINNINN